MPKFEVTLRAEAEAESIVIVEAEDQEKAEDFAQKQARDDKLRLSWDLVDDSVEYWRTDVFSATEADDDEEPDFTATSAAATKKASE